MWWYLEHVPDPLAVLRAASSLLKAGGILAVGVPSAEAMSYRIFGDRWFHLDPPRHLSIPSHRALKNAIESAGLTQVSVYEDFSPWGILGSLEYMSRGKIDDVSQSLVANRLADLILRPLSMAAAGLRRADCVAVYGQKLGNASAC